MEFFNGIYKSRILQIGSLSLGGDMPVRIQSMTNTRTMDTEATVRQVMQLQEAGCELVRITARNIREAENLGIIRNRLEKAGLNIPLVADIHFNPKVAEVAAAIVHKIRINPGNYIDKQYFLSKSKNLKTTEPHPDVIREGVIRLIKICREHGTVIRVGVNHGSLSERILKKYGNTAAGMLASAMEFLEICRDDGFNDLVVSMKSSHVATMINANEQLVKTMAEKGMDYPVHLGVTEAGEGEDGRIRSAAGIGPMLAKGIGDTIRVSLTEDPVAEIPVARKLIRQYEDIRKNGREFNSFDDTGMYHYKNTVKTGVLGENLPVAVVGEKSSRITSFPDADLLHISNDQLEDLNNCSYQIIPAGDEMQAVKGFHIIEFSAYLVMKEFLASAAKPSEGRILLFSGKNGEIKEIIKMFSLLERKKCRYPVLVKLDYYESDHESLMLKCSADLSALVLRDLGNGFWIRNQGKTLIRHSELVFGTLQATGRRITGTEYISCPGCGRTGFDIQDALKKIKEHTSGLINIKIAVMGCIVNGPGEMADADYGYVGEGNGKISLYHNGKPVKNNVPEENALEELLELIRNT